MRDGRHVGDGAHSQPRRLKSANGRFPSRPGALHKNIYLKHPIVHRVPCCPPRRLSGRKGSALSRAFETHRSAAGPVDDVPMRIGHRDDGVIESGMDVGQPPRHIALHPATRPPLSSLTSSHMSSNALSVAATDRALYFFFIPRRRPRPGTVLRAPRLVRALVRVR